MTSTPDGVVSHAQPGWTTLDADSARQEGWYISYLWKNLDSHMRMLYGMPVTEYVELRAKEGSVLHQRALVEVARIRLKS